MTAPAMSVDMRHTKLSAEDAALIAGEVVKPAWASRNEGIHERISFGDTLWGFELAGGSFYKTPLRVVYVKPGSRAEQACIRQGDTVLRINDIDTSTLTLQEAHDIVLESGIHLRISVTSPEDDVDAYYSYEDSIAESSRLAEELRKAMEAERIRKAIERAQRSCNLPWPWVRRKIIIYRESNCFLVPSTYESKHKEHYPDLPHVKYTDDICDMNRGTQIEHKTKENGHRANSQEPEKGEPVTDNEDDFENLSNVMDENEQNKILDEILEEETEDNENKNIPSDVEESTQSDIDTAHSDTNGEVLGPDNEEDGLTHELKNEEEVEELINEQVVDNLETEENNSSEILEESNNSQTKEESNEIETNYEVENNIPSVTEEDNVENTVNEPETAVTPASDFVNEDDSGVKSEEDNIVDGIVGDGEFNDSTNER